MLKEYRMQTILGIWSGIVFFAFGYLVFSLSQVLYRCFGVTMMLGGYVLFICGCFMYVKGKGHSWYLGLFGFLGPIGLLILYVLKDRSKIVLKKMVN